MDDLFNPFRVDTILGGNSFPGVLRRAKLSNAFGVMRPIRPHERTIENQPRLQALPNN